MATSGLMGGESLTKPRGRGARGGGRELVGRVSAQRAACDPDKMKKKLDSGVPREELPPRGFVRLGQTSTDILIGVEDISTWDNEEIRRGRKRDKNGGWQGRSPVVVPMALHQEAIKRTFEEAQELMREGLVPAVKLLRTILEDPDVDAKDRLKAADMIMNRVLGKPVERVEVNTEPAPWEDAVVSAVVPISQLAIDIKEVTEGDASVDQDS